MPDLKYAVMFSAVDQLSDKLSSFGGGFANLGDRVQDCATKLGDAAESLGKFGERLSLDAMLMKQGSDQLREFSDAIAEPAFAMQKSLATTAAMTGLAASELAKLKETAIAFSNTHPGITAEQYVSGFTRMREIFQDTNKALSAEDTAAMLTRFGVDGEAAANLFGTAYRNLGVDAATTGNQFFKTMSVWGLTADHAQQLAQAVGQLGGTAAATNTSFSELLSISAAASLQLGGGGRGAMMFASMLRELVSGGKSGVDWMHGFAGGLGQLKAHIAGLPATEKLDVLKKMGVSNPGMMLTFLDQLDDIAAKQRAMASGAVALGSAFTTATGDAADQLTLMHQNMDALYDTIASPALPMFSGAFAWLTTQIRGATSAAGPFSGALGDGLFVVSALGTGLGAAASALSTLGGTMLFVSKGMEALSYAPAIFSAIVSPMGLVVLGAAALALAGYEIYEHWRGIKTFFQGIGSWLGGWGATIGKAILMGIAGPFGLIASEIYSHWDSIKAACEKIGGGIKGFFVGHSPPPAGPLHDLGRITIAETIAERIRPAPILAAMRRTAEAAAIAGTVIVAGAAGPALAGGGAGGGIVINAPITINAGAGTDVAALEKVVLKAVERQRYEISRILEAERQRKERTALS